MSDKIINTYIAKVKECGCVVAACVDRPEYAKSTAKDVADWIKRGLVVERIQISESNPLSIGRCKHRSEQLSLVTK